VCGSLGGSPRSAHVRQILLLWLSKCGLTGPKVAKLVIFGINLQRRGIPLSDFFVALGKESQVRTITPNFTIMAIKMWAQALKIAKNGNFWYKFATKRKCWGSIEKHEYRCTTTNLPLCNGTIIVLIIILLHGISVITNFVIPKRDKQKKQTN